MSVTLAALLSSVGHRRGKVCCEAHAISFGGLDALGALRDAIMDGVKTPSIDSDACKSMISKDIAYWAKTFVYDRGKRHSAKWLIAMGWSGHKASTHCDRGAPIAFCGGLRVPLVGCASWAGAPGGGGAGRPAGHPRGSRGGGDSRDPCKS